MRPAAGAELDRQLIYFQWLVDDSWDSRPVLQGFPDARVLAGAQPRFFQGLKTTRPTSRASKLAE